MANPLPSNSHRPAKSRRSIQPLYLGPFILKEIYHHSTFERIRL